MPPSPTIKSNLVTSIMIETVIGPKFPTKNMAIIPRSPGYAEKYMVYVIIEYTSEITYQIPFSLEIIKISRENIF